MGDHHRVCRSCETMAAQTVFLTVSYVAELLMCCARNIVSGEVMDRDLPWALSRGVIKMIAYLKMKVLELVLIVSDDFKMKCLAPDTTT